MSLKMMSYFEVLGAVLFAIVAFLVVTYLAAWAMAKVEEWRGTRVHILGQTCKHCEMDISPRAKACPNCGEPDPTTYDEDDT